MKREDRSKYPAYAFPGMKSAYRLWVCAILLLACCFTAQAQQTYPVQVYTQLVPPYTPHIPAYYTGTQQKLKVMLINTDMQQPAVNVYLRMKIVSSSFSLITPPEVYTPQMELQAGMPVTLSLNDLEPYFKRENLRVSGGQSEFYRTQMLPDNFYRFHFEAYEVGTNRLVSNPKIGFAQAMIASGEPPILNLPQKGSVIKESNIPSIMFSWTPKHMNSIAAAYGTEYDISLVEIYDKQVAPEAAFDYSRVLYTETTKSTSFIHTVAQPLLIPGMRYAWRVQAKAREGVDEISVFKNNGYSPVSWFDYTADCKTVQSCGAIYENGHVDISWQDAGAMEYTVEYRKKGTSRWYTGTINKPLLSQLYNLQAGKDYEYRIGSRCVAGDAFQYNDLQAFHIPDRQENGPNCGLMPDISLTNRTPARELQSGMPVLVGDFPVFITKVSGSGRFTGEGYVGIPYLQGAQIAVTFKDIVVNTDNRLVEGFFETKYDTKNNNLLFDADQYQTGGKGVGDIRSGEEQAAFKVDYTINPDIKALPLKADGTKDEIKEGTDYTISKGENGKYTFILIDSEGKEHKVEADSMPATIEDKEGNTYEVNEKGEVKPVSKVSDIKLDSSTKDTQSKLATLSFKATKNTKYALDEYNSIYEKVTEYNDQYKPEGTAITASAKFMLPGVSDEISVYIKDNKDNKLIPEKVRFITGKGREYPATYDNQTKGWTLTIVGGQANDGQELYAVQDTGDDKYETLGKLNIFTYEPFNRSVTLVPVNGAMNGLDKQTVQNGLNEIYGKVGIHWTVNVLEKPFSYTPKNGSTFNVTGSGLLSMFTDDMKAINEAFKTSGEYQEDGLYLFVIGDKASESGTEGDMPLGSQFGYLFPNATIRTIAHEAGHGAFNLEHPFDRPGRNSFPQKGMLEYNLMDYPTKDAEKWTELVKLQWDQTRAPGHVIGLFQTDKSGMSTEDGTPSQYILEAYKRLEKIGELVDENHFVILYSTICSWAIEKDEPKIIEFSLTNVETGLPVGTVGMPAKAKAVEYIYGGRINVAISVNLGDNGWNYNTSSGITISETTKEDLAKIAATTFFGLLTKDKVYQCEPPEYPVCDKKNLGDDFYALMLTSIAKCIEENEQNVSSNKVGDSFFYWAISKYPDIDKDVIRTISDKQNKIADILFKNQVTGNEWKEYGEYFEASFDAAVKANNINNGDYLKRLTEYIRIFEGKLDQLGRMDHEQIALFVGTFTDNELLYLPMNLRIKTMDLLSQSLELKNLLNSQKQSQTIVNWAMRENMILKLLERIEPGEEKELLEQLKTSGTIKRINNNLDDFITLVDDNYTKFLDIIDGYVFHVNRINEQTYGRWLQQLYEEDKVYNISRIDKVGEPFISATGIDSRGIVELHLKEFNGKYDELTVETFDGNPPYTDYTPLYDTRRVEIPFDQPIAIYHNSYLSGISTDNLGQIQLASALRAHYYLQKHKDEVTATAIWTTVDVATLLVGVGEISAAVKAASKWRLVLGVCNTSSSVGSLLATGMDSYIISNYGKEGEEFIQSLRKVSAVLGFVDLGVAGVRKFGNMLDDDLVTIGKFHQTHSSQMKNSSNLKEKNLEQVVQKLIDNYDDDLVRTIRNTSQNTDALVATLRTSYPKLYDRIAYIQESLRKDFLTDFAENAGALEKFNNNPDLLDAWQALNLAKRAGLRTDMDAIESLGKLMENNRLTQFGIKQGDFADMLKAGWGGQPYIPSFKTFCDEVNQLIDALPNNTTGLNRYLGSAGFTNAQGYTQRHAYTQLQRLLDNKDILSRADNIEFEKAISQAEFGIGNSVSDVQLVMKDRTIIEIETKAGMEFFENLGSSSNFMTQSGNSLMKVSGIEDYKIFLNPGLVTNKQAAINKVVDAWSKQGWFGNDNILRKFSNYFKQEVDDASELESLLRNNTNWFDEIFTKNIQQ